jgi:hypothetical protein
MHKNNNKRYAKSYLVEGVSEELLGGRVEALYDAALIDHYRGHGKARSDLPLLQAHSSASRRRGSKKKKN